MTGNHTFTVPSAPKHRTPVQHTSHTAPGICSYSTLSFQSNPGLCPADKPPPQLTSVSPPYKNPSRPWNSPHKAGSRLTELCWRCGGCSPKPAPTLPGTDRVPGAGRLGGTGRQWEALGSHSSYCTIPRAPAPPAESRRMSGARRRLEPALTSATRCRFLLAMTVRQPCLRGRGR